MAEYDMTDLSLSREIEARLDTAIAAADNGEPWSADQREELLGDIFNDLENKADELCGRVASRIEGD